MSQTPPSSITPAPYGYVQGAKYCQTCGAQNDPGAGYCTSCGAMSFGPSPLRRVGMPAGVAILAILQMLGSLLTIFVGLTAGAIIPVFGPAFGLVVAGIGFITLICAIALFTGRNWARILNMVFAAINLISFPIGTIIGIIFLIYFTRPHVVAYFKQPRVH